jgi:hypothetical protein
MIVHFAPYLAGILLTFINIRTRGRQLAKAVKRISQSNSFTLTALSQMQGMKQVKPVPRWQYQSEHGPQGLPEVTTLPAKSNSSE